MNRPFRPIGTGALLAIVAVAELLPCSRPRAQSSASPDQQGPARFAILVGANQSVDRDARALRYADDDAAGYLELFRALGARTYVLSRFDENTRRLYPQAAAESLDPRRGELDRVVDQIAADVALARKHGIATAVYFVFAGHGGVNDGRGYLALEDDRIYGADLDHLVDRVGAGETHFIVDACYSVFLAFSRGPGGERRPVQGFAGFGGLAARPGVGLLLSTSSARESHEWSEFQAGVFSHEVRSGLLGAADADGDGRITYREIAAFVERANAPIPNDRFRPELYAKPPSSGGDLLDLRSGLARRFEVDGDHPGRYVMEDARGVRIADFHNASGQSLHLVRPAGLGRLFLRKVGPDQDLEYVVESAPAVVHFADLSPHAARTGKRGALEESFQLLFALPFSQTVVDAFVEAPSTELRAPDRPPHGDGSARRTLMIGMFGLGAATAIGGTWAVLSARSLERQSETTQLDAYRSNQLIDRRNGWARVLYGVSSVALLTGAVLWLLPSTRELSAAASLGVDVHDGRVALGWTGKF